MAERAAVETPRPTEARLNVVVAGGGIAALESAAALHSLAADHVALTLIAPNREFAQRSVAPLAAFGVEVPPRVPLAALADRLGADLVTDRVAWVDRFAQAVHCASGDAIAFEALVLGLGATARARFAQALTLDDSATTGLSHLLADVAARRATRIALVAPERVTWPLPLYEVALMVATFAARHNAQPALMVVTAEPTPLHAFGDVAGAEMLTLLTERGIDVLCGTSCQVPARDRLVLAGEGRRPGLEVVVDRVIALPELVGPHVRGLPSAPYGFIPVDRFCHVPGTSRTYAAGDGTDYPVKHGAIAAQQAEVAARSIAAAAGAPVRPRPFHPTLEGVLLTGGRPRYLAARLVGGHPFGSEAESVLTDAATAPLKLSAPYLTALLSEIRC